MAFRVEIHTHDARVIQMQISSVDRDRGDTLRRRHVDRVSWPTPRARVISSLSSSSSSSPRFSRICCACAPPFFSLAWVKGPFFGLSGYTRVPRELNSRSSVVKTEERFGDFFQVSLSFLTGERRGLCVDTYLSIVKHDITVWLQRQRRMNTEEKK